MEDVIQQVGGGIVGLIAGVIDTIGDFLRGVIAQLQGAFGLPLLAAIVVAVLLVLAWNLARR